MKGNARVDLGLLILRIGLGLVFLFYGSQKMLGLFGGRGYTAQVNAFIDQGIPPVFAHLAIVAEFFGALGVLFGVMTPVAAFGLACVMAVAVYRNMSGGAFSAVFQGTDAHRLFFPLGLFFMSLALTFLGAGRYALDQKLFRTGGKK